MATTDLSQTVDEGVGRITRLVGDAFILRADGTRHPAHVGDPVYHGDFIEVSPVGGTRIILTEGTVLSIAAESRAVLDDVIYDPVTGEASVGVSLIDGSIVVSTGALGSGGSAAVSVTTNAGDVLLSNAHVAARLGEDGALEVVVLGHVETGQSEVVVSTSSGTWVLDQPLHSVFVNPDGVSPEGVRWADGAVVEARYADLLDVARTGVDVPQAADPIEFETATPRTRLRMNRGLNQSKEARRTPMAWSSKQQAARRRIAARKTVRYCRQSALRRRRPSFHPVLTPARHRISPRRRRPNSNRRKRPMTVVRTGRQNQSLSLSPRMSPLLLTKRT